jgi:hypothetical protein
MNKSKIRARRTEIRIKRKHVGAMTVSSTATNAEYTSNFHLFLSLIGKNKKGEKTKMEKCPICESACGDSANN